MPALKDLSRVTKLRQTGCDVSEAALRRKAQYSLILAYVAAAHHTKPEFLLADSRGSKHLSGARHIANYLAHIVYGMNFTDIGLLAARDRTSIAHGCKKVEDLRDAKSDDRALHFAELALQSYFSASWEANDDDEHQPFSPPR
jgi:chromosomal replication initiation ATPase DnaA